jgi:hypothetical protein
MMSSTTLLRSTARVAIIRRTQQRTFSSECAPAQKLRLVLEEYRQKNYSREIPSRFKKDLLRAVPSENGFVPVDSLNSILVNIGRSDSLLTEQELTTLLQEAGASCTEGRNISTQAVLQLV